MTKCAVKKGNIIFCVVSVRVSGAESMDNYLSVMYESAEMAQQSVYVFQDNISYFVNSPIF